MMRKVTKSIQTETSIEAKPISTDDLPGAQYDCAQCPAICCAVYPRVQVTPRDLLRLAKHFNVAPEVAQKRFTKVRGGERVLRRKRDTIFADVCQFLDMETRRCGIYHARPAVCRTFPEGPRCAYFDLLQFEREHQQDATVIPLIELTFREM